MLTFHWLILGVNHTLKLIDSKNSEQLHTKMSETDKDMIIGMQ